MDLGSLVAGQKERGGKSLVHVYLLGANLKYLLPDFKSEHKIKPYILNSSGF